MDTLGPVAVLVGMQNRQLLVDFKVSEQTIGSLNKSLPLLRHRLIDAGIESARLSSSIFEPKSNGGRETPKAGLKISV